MDVALIAQKLVGLTLVMGLGVLLAKLGIIDKDFNSKLTGLVLNVTMPCMILASVSTPTSAGLPVGDVLVCIALLVVVLPLVGLAIVRLPAFRKDRGLYLFMTMYPNVGFMGFPVIESVFGSDALIIAAVINMAFNISLFTVGVLAIGYGNSGGARLDPKKIASPGVVASVLAIVVYLVGKGIPALVADPLSSVGQMTTPLAMLVIGASLASYPLREVVLDLRPWGLTLLADVILPLAFLPVFRLLVSDALVRGVAVVILGMPVASGATLFAERYGGNAQLASKCIFVSTLCSVATIPLLVATGI